MFVVYYSLLSLISVFLIVLYSFNLHRCSKYKNEFEKEIQLYYNEKQNCINFTKCLYYKDLKKIREKSSYRKIGYGGHPKNYIFSYPLDKKIIIKPVIVSKAIDLMIFIHSRPEEFYERLLYRKSCIKLNQVKIIFITSKSDSKRVNEKLKYESDIYGDVLQFNEISSYFNLSMQTVHMIIWCENNVKFKFMLKTDIDVFINIPLILEKIKIYQTKKELLAIGRLSKTYVIRDKKYSHFVPKDIIKENMFPPYLQGVGYIMPYTTVKKIVKSIEFVNPKIWIEDVFMGYLFRYNNISLIDFSSLIIREINDNDKISYIINNIDHYMLIHGFYPIEIYFLNKMYIKNNYSYSHSFF